MALRSNHCSHCNDPGCCRQHEWVDRRAEHLTYENAAESVVGILLRVIEIDETCTTLVAASAA